MFIYLVSTVQLYFCIIYYTIPIKEYIQKILQIVNIIIDIHLMEVSMNKCETCEHFTGAGDWNLCCNIPHPTPKEKEMGLEFYFGHICYKDTEACDMYEPKGEYS